MSVDLTVLALHLDYTAWATGRLLESAASLSEEELTRDFRASEKSVLGTLAHVFEADRIWLERVRGQVPASFRTDYSLAELTSGMPAVCAGWRAWLAEQSDADIQRPLTYRDMKGRVWTQAPWMIVLHAVNHATHHRGQVSGFLRAMGKTPPGLDLILYYRSLEAAPSGA